MIRAGTKLAQPPFVAKDEYERLSLRSPEFKPFDVQQEERPNTTEYIPLTEEMKEKRK